MSDPTTTERPDKQDRGVTGQQVIPGMADELGYEAILLDGAKERFCWHYSIYKNGRAAYQHAHPGVTEATARSEASKLLKLPYISQRLEEIYKLRTAQYSDDREAVCNFFRTVLTFDRNELLDSNGGLRRLADIPMDVAAVLDIDVQIGRTGGTVALIKVPERRGAATELARILGMNNDKLHVTNDVTAMTDDELKAELERLAREVLSESDQEMPGDLHVAD
jgi:hypothetical protein